MEILRDGVCGICFDKRAQGDVAQNNKVGRMSRQWTQVDDGDAIQMGVNVRLQGLVKGWL